MFLLSVNTVFAEDLTAELMIYPGLRDDFLSVLITETDLKHTYTHITSEHLGLLLITTWKQHELSVVQQICHHLHL